MDIEHYNINEEQAKFSSDPSERGKYKIVNKGFYANILTLGLRNTHPINSYHVDAAVEQHKELVKLNLTANYHFAYKKHGTGLDIRFFVGRFLYNKDEPKNSRFNYNLSGGQASDYLYNEIFLGRNTTERAFNQQFSVTDGGFKNLVLAETDGQFIAANKWLNAVNLKSNFINKYISFYADLGLVGTISRDENNNEIDKVSDLAYDIGVSLNVIPNMFEIYFPFTTSSELNQLSYLETIRFTLNINTLNPLKLVRDFQF